ncbi:hypothetical protein E0K89_002490 [Aquicoccus sp. SCR17]|nr:hypothetical protein [Carideicomes alvinocaridis]
MTRLAMFLGLLALLAACSTPMERVNKLSEVELAEDAGRAGALPDPASERRAKEVTGNFFSALFGGGGATADTASVDPKSLRGEAGAAVADGAAPPYGELVRACNRSSGLGQEIERHSGYRLYDSAPGASGMRSFFVTGFEDGCPRQFTAAMAMFGSAEMHEQLRYGLPRDVQPYSNTDSAYEQVKARVCGVGRQEPCGTRIKRLDRDTVFLSIYERFGSNPEWANILLHDGEVEAMDLKNG